MTNSTLYLAHGKIVFEIYHVNLYIFDVKCVYTDMYIILIKISFVFSKMIRTSWGLDLRTGWWWVKKIHQKLIKLQIWSPSFFKSGYFQAQTVFLVYQNSSFSQSQNNSYWPNYLFGPIGMFSFRPSKHKQKSDKYRTRAIITRGLYTFDPLFEVQKRFFKGIFSLNSGLMYG